MRRSNRLKNNKGFTLLEIIVALIILGVILTAIFSFFQYGNLMTVKDNEQYVIQSEMRYDIDQIITEIKYANEIYLLETKPTESEKENSEYSYIYLDGGKFYFSIYQPLTNSRLETVAKGTYKDVETNFSKDTELIDSLNIVLSSQYYNQTYEVDAKIKLQNLKLNSPTGSVQGSTTSQVIKFKVPQEN